MIDKMYEQVLEFSRTYGFQIGDENTLISDNLRKQRFDLIHEEICEYVVAKKEGNRIEMLDALCDIMYVTLGSFITFGIPIKNSNVGMQLCDFTDDLTHGDKTCMRLYLESVVANVSTKAFNSHFDFMNAFIEVHRSNMSKGCNSLDEVHATMAQQQYKDIPYHYVIKDNKWFIHRLDNGKLIKSIGYSKAELDKYI
jgi:predicted HAD superfamily Cof-like phosphohydrolase